MSESNPKLARFNECRNTFMTSLNSIAILVFLTIFVPYTTYVGNLLAIRVKTQTPLILKEEEQQGNFDLKKLEAEWLKAHGSSVSETEMLSGSTEFNNPVGKFNFSKPEIVLIYPAAVCVLLVYLSLQFYELLNLKQKLKNEDEELVKIPWWRIAIASISLVFFLMCSWWIILSPPKIPEGNTSQLVKIESRSGKIIAKESSALPLSVCNVMLRVKAS